MNRSDLPRFDQLMFPVIEALREAGGSGLRNEIIEAVADRQGLSEEQLERRYETTGIPVVADRIGWALSWLKKLDAVENSRRGVWALTAGGRGIVSEEEVAKRLRVVRSEVAAQAARTRREAQQGKSVDEDTDPADGLDDEGGDWKGQLLQRLLEMSPEAFERLTQRLLREAGFRDVEVLGKAGDGGIDGVGVYRLSLVSFPIYFQCKRYKGSVSAGTVRDFRGAMAGRGEKG
ncbi:MAG: Mrr restriction system protein, partial [Acidimicrobiaceae bacterium]|nr:Mrr restriction system protein [Acidimicrobiaceae bacterium]